MTTNDGSLLGFEGTSVTYLHDQFGLGESIWHNDVEYLFCQVTRTGGAPAGFWLFVQEDFAAAGGVFTGGATYPRSIAVAQHPVAQGSFAWLAVRGSGFMGLVAEGFGANANVFTQGASGTVDDEPSGNVRIGGGLRSTSPIANGTAFFVATNRLHVTPA